MGIGVVVHGFISWPGWGTQAPSERVFAHNIRVIESLPESDSEWPFITRSMFSILPLRRSLDDQFPQYEHGVAYFAGAYKDMFALEAEWIHKFEKLLSQLCWSRAVVYTEFAGNVYEWRAEWPSEDFLIDPPIPPKRWKLTCGKVTYDGTPLAEAIIGEYKAAS